MIEIEAVDGVNLNDFDTCMNLVQDVPVAALFEQVAEEAAELAKAVLKLARIVRGENPTPVTRYEAMCMAVEELSDLTLACEVAGIAPDRQIQVKKLKRWAERLKEGGGNAE